MTPDEIANPADAEAEAPVLPTLAAPPRAKRLFSKPVPPPEVRRAPLPAVSSFSQPVMLPERANRTPLERKLAGMYDATEMLRVLDTEIVLQRVKRTHGGGSRQTLRVAALALFFTLLIAALGAMSYLQSKLAERGFSRHRTGPAPVVTASQERAPSAPVGATAPPPAGAGR